MTDEQLSKLQEAMRSRHSKPPDSSDHAQILQKPKKTRRKSVHAIKPLAGKPKRKTNYNPNSLKGLKMWPKGVSGNPSGLPGYDVAAEIARRVMEEWREDAFQGLGKQLRHGNAYVFKELAERGYGKMKEKLELSGADEIATQLEAARKRKKKP
jgi:hypothetical protein